jgi:hypothetical protein
MEKDTVNQIGSDCMVELNMTPPCIVRIAACAYYVTFDTHDMSQTVVWTGYICIYMFYIPQILHSILIPTHPALRSRLTFVIPITGSRPWRAGR